MTNYQTIIQKELANTWNPADIGSWRLFEIWKLLRESQIEIDSNESRRKRFKGQRLIAKFLNEFSLTPSLVNCPPLTKREYTCRQLMEIEKLPDECPQEIHQVWMELRAWKAEFASQEILVRPNISK